jgi:hypothetical protein
MIFLKKAVVVLAIIPVLYLSGCTEKQRQDYSHWKSDVIGLKRTITLYDGNGKPIKSWSGRVKVDAEGCTARFIVDGKAVMISGTFVIEEN